MPGTLIPIATMPLQYNKDYPHGMVALNDPTTLLLPDTERKDWRKNVLFPLTGGALGLVYPFLKNWYADVPLRTGLYQFPMWIAIGAVSGKLIEDWRAYLMAERDAHYKQYIRNHPEDFLPESPEERKKVGDLLKPWTPIR